VVFARDTIYLSAKSDDAVAKNAVIHVETAFEDDAAGVDV
jgi:hypothetical protein